MKIINQARVDYQYRADPTKPIVLTTTYSNRVTTTILPEVLKVKKFVNKCRACVCDVLTYTVFITNPNNSTVKKVFFQDIIAPELKFVPNSLIINGIRLYCKDPNQPIHLGNMGPNKKFVITFKVWIRSCFCGHYVKNYSKVFYCYKFDISKPPTCVYIKSNTVFTCVEHHFY